MWGFQAAGAAPLVVGHRIEQPETVATAIRIGDPASWDEGDRRRATTRAAGSAPSPTTRSSPRTGRSPATRASSASPRRRRASPASRKAAAAGELDPDATVVCVLTGHGLKDPTTAERQVPPFLEAEPTVGAVAVALGW